MTTPIQLTETMLEGTTGLYSFHLVDMEDVGIDMSFLTSVTLTLTDGDSQTIINGREDQNILNANGGTVVTEGFMTGVVTTVTMALTPADTIILNTHRVAESRILTFRWTWNSGQAAGAHAVQFVVEALPHAA